MMGYAIAATIAASLGGFFTGSALVLHPLNRDMRMWGVVLGICCFMVALAALVGVARA